MNALLHLTLRADRSPAPEVLLRPGLVEIVEDDLHGGGSTVTLVGGQKYRVQQSAGTVADAIRECHNMGDEA